MDAAARGDALPAVGRFPFRAAVSLLLDGYDVAQTQCGAAFAHRQPGLGGEPDARSLPPPPVQHAVSRLDVAYGARLGRLHVLLSRRDRLRRLRDPATAPPRLAADAARA